MDPITIALIALGALFVLPSPRASSATPSGAGSTGGGSSAKHDTYIETGRGGAPAAPDGPSNRDLFSQAMETGQAAFEAFTSFLGIVDRAQNKDGGS